MSSDYEGVRIGRDVEIGPHCVIDPGAELGDGSRIGSFVRIFSDTVVGESCTISDHAVVGKRPQLSAGSSAARAGLGPLVLGSSCTVGSHAVLFAGSTYGDDCTVGDRALVRERCTLGNRVVVGSGATVENDTSIGSRTRIQTGAYVTAYMTIEDDVFIAPMVVTTNDNHMGRTEASRTEMRGPVIRRGARIGGGAHLLPGVEIGEDAFVATASVVTRDVAPRTVVMGSPARPVRDVPDDELLTR